MLFKNLFVFAAGISAVSAAILPRDVKTIVADVDAAAKACTGFTATVKTFLAIPNPTVDKALPILGANNALMDSLTKLTTSLETQKPKLTEAESKQVADKLPLVGYYVIEGLETVLGGAATFKSLGVAPLLLQNLDGLHVQFEKFKAALKAQLTAAHLATLAETFKGIDATVAKIRTTFSA